MKQLIILIIIIIIITPSCKKELITTELEIVWETEFTDVLASSIEPVIYNDIVIFTRERTNIDLHPPLLAYNKKTGEKLWEWNDFEEDVFVFTGWDYRYTYENYLVFTGHHSAYCIDMNTGKTVWNDTDFNFMTHNHVKGLNDKVYYVRGSADGSERWIISQNVVTGISYKVVEFETINEHKPILYVPDFHINSNGDTSLIITYLLYDIHKLSAKFHWGVYNMVQDKFRHLEHITDSTGSGNIGEPIVKDNKAYIGIGNTLFCYDIESRSQLWKVWIEGKIGFTNYIIEDGKVYCGSEGLDPKLYSIDIETGQVLWTTSTAGVCSPMSYYNGDIYFTSNQLHVIDGSNGQYVGKYEAPHSHENRSLFFSQATSLDPVTGRIFTTDYKNLYCIEPVR